MVISFVGYAIVLAAIVHMSYVYAMGVKRAYHDDELRWPVMVLAVPTLAIMLPLYILLNVTVGTVLFLELPRDVRFTRRVQRHMEKDDWRGAQARWWCDHFLDPFDEGGHC